MVPKTVDAYVPTSASSNSTSFASIRLSDGTNYLLYYNTTNDIACLYGTDAGTFSNTTVQPSSGVVIQAGSLSPLAATAWENDDGTLKEVRLYYVEASTNIIKELCSADGKTWYSGKLDNEQYKIASSGGLAATCGAKQGLKVFFADADNSGQIVEAYINTDTGKWQKYLIQ